MKKAIVFGLALLIAGTAAYADEIASRTGETSSLPHGSGYSYLRDASDVLIYQTREQWEGTWGDLIPIYEAALTTAGATVSAVDAPTEGGAFPGDYSPTNYCVTFCLTSENFHSPTFPPGDEATVQAYLGAGGNVYFSGQDYCYGNGYGDGAVPDGSLPNMMGLGSVINDTPFGAEAMDCLGANLFDGWYMFTVAADVFLGNPFYPDTFTPSPDGLVAFTQLSPEQHDGAVYTDPGAYRAVFTSLELSGDELAVFPDYIAFTWDWLAQCEPTPVEETNFGTIKANYR